MKRTIDFGSVTYEGKEYHLQAQAEPTSRLLPDHLTGCFEMAALAIGPDDQAYEVTWIFTDDGRELDAYDYTDVHDVQPAGVPVYLVKMVRGDKDAWDETHTDPEVILRTLDLKEALACQDSTGVIPLDEHNLQGEPQFLAPAIIRQWGDEETMID